MCALENLSLAILTARYGQLVNAMLSKPRMSGESAKARCVQMKGPRIDPADLVHPNIHPSQQPRVQLCIYSACHAFQIMHEKRECEISIDPWKYPPYSSSPASRASSSTTRSHLHSSMASSAQLTGAMPSKMPSCSEIDGRMKFSHCSEQFPTSISRSMGSCLFNSLP